MRICHVSPHLPPDQAANALLPAELGGWAAARGDQVSFVAHVPVQTDASRVKLAGPITWIRRRSSRGLLDSTLRLDAMRVVRDVDTALEAAASDADLLHLHSNGLIVEAAARFAAKRRIPYVLTLYGTEIWHYKPKWPIDWFTRAYRGAAQVTFYSRLLMEKAEALGLGRGGLSVVYPAVSERFSPQDASTRAARRESLGVRERQLILNVKRLHELAGQKDLIDAFARVARDQSDVRLVICGTGPLRAALEAQAAALRIADRVTFAGLVPNDLIARYCAAADVFALPSLLEALPTVAVEALASGTPVVSADHPGGVELHALFGADVTVVRRESPEPLAAAISGVLSDRRRTTIETARTVDRLFRPDAVLAAYDVVYAAAARKR